MEHYYTSQQSSSFVPYVIKCILRGTLYEFQSASGVFSKKKIDFGTKVLVENMKIKENQSVLDLGCGIGIVGRVAASLTKSKVTLTDVNKRAVKLAKFNTSKLSNVEVIESDGFESLTGKKFDVVLLNPPQTAGKKVCQDLIKNAKSFLSVGGNIQIVARHNKGGEQLSLFMESVYHNVETIVKKGGYRVYVSVA
jgi:16S rRNA (guanine1207-N2)-methyltransferase